MAAIRKKSALYERKNKAGLHMMSGLRFEGSIDISFAEKMLTIQQQNLSVEFLT